MMFSCNYFQLKELIDIRPEAGSQYIRPTTGPFDEEMEISDRRAVIWLVHFGLVSKKGQLSRSHASDSTQIKKVIEDAKAKKLVPLQAAKEKHDKPWHKKM